MAIPKTLGIETEFGIWHRGTDESNHIAASSLLINAYLYELSGSGGPKPKVGWDFEDESPANDARGYTPLDALPPEVETHLVNAVLTNGARYYVDHAHPELSTPECADALSVVRFDKSAELIVQRSMNAAKKILPPGQELVVYKNNSDGKGNSYGCHENYLMDRHTPFGRIVTHATAHFVSRQIFTGAGKVGTEAHGLTAADVPFQLTQRADFFEEEVGLETTLKRPIINTRDEPHADPQKYRRLHVIVGDANLSEVATFLKVGTTAFVLTMVEDDFLPRDFVLAAPVQALRQVSYDVTLGLPLRLADGTTVTALDMQWELYERARKYADERGTDNVGGDVALAVLDRWESVLGVLEDDPMKLTDQIDWVAKYHLVSAYRERHWHRLGRRPAAGHRPAIPRPSPRQVLVPAPSDATARRRRCRSQRHLRPTHRHPRLLPRRMPAALARRHRRRQLGLIGLRHRCRAAAARADDGAAAGHQGPCRCAVRLVQHSGRTTRSIE